MRTTTLLLCLSLASCGQYAKQSDLDATNDKLDDVSTRLSDLSGKVSANTSAIDSLSTSYSDSQNLYQLLIQDLANADQAFAQDLQYSIDTAESTSNNLLAMIETLQVQTTELLGKQAALELEDRVIGIYDPCPLVASTSFKESLFQMSSGKLVAYFEDGNKRFLTVLKTGTAYRTTDSRACVFSI